MGLVGELWDFMKERKKWWLLPVIVVMLGCHGGGSWISG